MIFSQYFSELGKVFLKNDILSIDIGFTNIKVVHARKKRGDQLKIINYGIGTTPPGCIKNGVIYNIEGIVDNLKKLIDGNKINEKNVKIVISAGSNVISRVMLIEKRPGRNMEEAIREEAARDMPVSIDDQKLFYRITGEALKDGKSYERVLVTAVPNKVIDNYVKVINRLNFKPLAIEIPFSSVARFFSKGVSVAGREEADAGELLSELGRGCTAVVDLGSETTNLSIINQGLLEFNRIILSGGRGMDEMVAAKLGMEREIAEKYKKLYGLEVPVVVADETVDKVAECIREYLGEILSNVKRSIEFYTVRCGGQEVDRLVFIGGGAALNGLKGFAEERMGISAFTLEMLSLNNIQIESNLDREKIRFLVNAVGIAL